VYLCDVIGVYINTMNYLNIQPKDECVELEIKEKVELQTLHELQTVKKNLEKGLDLDCKDK
jgi:hypothetical protein